MTPSERREAAEKATQGPWHLTFETHEEWIAPDDTANFLTWALEEPGPSNEDYPWCEPFLSGYSDMGWAEDEPITRATLEFIAANDPATVLADLDRIEALEAENERLRAGIAALEPLADPLGRPPYAAWERWWKSGEQRDVDLLEAFDVAYQTFRQHLRALATETAPVVAEREPQ